MSSLDDKPEDGTDMPHAVSGTQTPAGAGRFLTQKAKSNKADGIRGLLPLEGPGIVSFVGWSNLSEDLADSAGRPNPTTFPFERITLSLKAPLESRLPNKDGVHSTNGDGEGEEVVIDGQDLDQALQYGPTPGLAKLRNLLLDVQEKLHKRPKGDWTVNVGSGTQDLMYKTFLAVLEPGDPVLVETPLYAGAMPPLKNIEADCIEVGIDEGGLSPKLLEGILSSWPEGKKRPKCLYTNPIGCNPSGCSAGRERKLEILKICKRYDILIIEDDPYYFLTPELIPSYFELEPEVISPPGQIIRFDSFSKILSGGMRLGYATGPTALISAIDVQTSGTNLHTSGVSQILAYSLLKSWGMDGLLSHSKAVAEYYRIRRVWFEEIARKHLGELADWVSPVAGMFLWIDLSKSGIDDTEKLVKVEALANGVLAVPGYAFYPGEKAKSSHVRVSFSEISKEDAELGISRLAKTIRQKRDALQAGKSDE